MNELQKKVLLFLLKTLDGIDWGGCDETAVTGLADEDRRNLTMMLWSHWDLIEEWDGEANKVFGIGAMIDLAQYWITGEK